MSLPSSHPFPPKQKIEGKNVIFSVSISGSPAGMLTSGGRKHRGPTTYRHGEALPRGNVTLAE